MSSPRLCTIVYRLRSPLNVAFSSRHIQTTTRSVLRFGYGSLVVVLLGDEQHKQVRTRGLRIFQQKSRAVGKLDFGVIPAQASALLGLANGSEVHTGKLLFQPLIYICPLVNRPRQGRRSASTAPFLYLGHPDSTRCLS